MTEFLFSLEKMLEDDVLKIYFGDVSVRVFMSCPNKFRKSFVEAEMGVPNGEEVAEAAVAEEFECGNPV